ncbi:sulfite exporter TauE/SafE family protein [Niallia sp. Krafla_26]|uniref:sulfite exporter TauE/SafE family protein n=1 Tax=Niallia sp. Krafla_26 TaxID=3064703 RepID=UPI003D162D80
MFDFEVSLILAIMLAGLLTSFGKTTGLNVLGIFTVTMLSLFFPAKEAVGLLLPVLLMGDLLAVIYYRRTVVWKHLFSLVPWILLGVLAGYFVLSFSDNEQLKIMLGYLIIGLNLFQIIKDYFGSKMDHSLPSSIWFIGLMGILAGFATMIGNVAGTVMAIYLLAHRLPKNEFVGTGAWFYLFVNVIKVPFYIHLGMITANSFTINLMAIPAVALGAFVGIKVLPRIPQQMFKWIILALGTLGALRLIVPSLQHYILVLHIITMMIACISGVASLMMRNRQEIRTLNVKIFSIVSAILFITTTILAIMDWNKGVFFFFVSLLSFLTALFGYRGGRQRRNHWRLKQTIGAIGAYIGILSAVLISLDSHLLSGSSDTLMWWFIPFVIGVVLISWFMNHAHFEIEEHHGLNVKNK